MSQMKQFLWLRREQDLEQETVNSGDEDSGDEGPGDEDTSGETVYNISVGNAGFVLVNHMTDYMNRGPGLEDMCLYEYCSKVYKTVVKNEEKERHFK